MSYPSLKTVGVQGLVTACGDYSRTLRTLDGHFVSHFFLLAGENGSPRKAESFVI